MKISEQLKEIAKHKEYTITELASLMNTSQANLANKLVRDNFRLSDIEEIANALGYTDIEIVLRGSKEDAVILHDSVEYKSHDVYMVFDENKSLIDDIKENGFRDKQFKHLVMELLEPTLRPKFGDLWDTYVPKHFEEGFKAVVKNQMTLDDLFSIMGNQED